ncbi:MAG TPA: dTDP-4-dehydrorhamnose 3,5-epimerase family protein [Tepidisphaeraceae bacterium]|jgi:dTDP-4-dehydrorhamnose 3,5-epimerase
MRIIPTAIPGVHVIEATPVADDRGYFARTWDRDALEEAGLDTALHLCAVTQNRRRGTLRGMHFQRPPHAETKFVRVTRGAIFDVALDLRPESPTFRQWHGETLTAENHRQLYVPAGCAHGYLTLSDDAELTYMLSAAYAPAHAGGVRYDDPAFAIEWPGPINVVAPRDAQYPLVPR